MTSLTSQTHRDFFSANYAASGRKKPQTANRKKKKKKKAKKFCARTLALALVTLVEPAAALDTQQASATRKS